MLGRRAALGGTVVLLAATGAGATFAATRGSSPTTPSQKPAQQQPARHMTPAVMPHGHCHDMGSPMAGASAAVY
jgi:hypothetical protein